MATNQKHPATCASPATVSLTMSATGGGSSSDSRRRRPLFNISVPRRRSVKPVSLIMRRSEASTCKAGMRAGSGARADGRERSQSRMTAPALPFSVAALHPRGCMHPRDPHARRTKLRALGAGPPHRARRGRRQARPPAMPCENADGRVRPARVLKGHRKLTHLQTASQHTHSQP